MLFVHIRSFLARHRAIHWALVLGLAASVGLIVAARSAALEHERQAWGDTRTVWVATSTLVPGEVLTADAVELPLAALPSTAATGDPTGTMVLQHIGRGEVITSADVGSVDDLLPPGWRGVAIAADDRTLRVSVGDRVDVIAMGRPIAMDGVVIEASPTVVVIGVPGDVAADVATAAHDLLVVLVRR